MRNSRVVLFNEYQLKPLRSGQICVAEAEGGVLAAYRSLDAGAQGLYWEMIGVDELESRAAIIGFCTFEQHVTNSAWQPFCAVTAAQLAQLMAHRTALVAREHAEVGDLPLTRIAQQAIDHVTNAVLGESINPALRGLAQLGLDIGESRDRKALQIVINLAESNGAAELLEHLDIEPHARDGFVNAVTWLKTHATPQLLNAMANLASNSMTARLLVTSRIDNTKQIDAAPTYHLKSARDA